MSAPDAPLLDVRELTKHFPVRRGILRRTVGWVRAVDGVTLSVAPGETLGLVGESGSGKTTLARAILRLDPPTAGKVRFEGADLAGLQPDELRRVRRRLQVVFQDPFASLSPRMRVGRIVREPLDVHRVGSASERDERVAALMERVGLDPGFASRHPHQLSGGQRQRVGIARALATGPRMVIADEPISALDVSIQAQIVNLLEELRAELGLTYLFIAHDLSMVRHVSDRVAVMYLGKLVEQGGRDALFRRPLHPYTRALLAAMPRLDFLNRPNAMARPDHAGAPPRPAPPTLLPGTEPPDPANPPEGCRFHPRCPFATERCRREEPEWRHLPTDPQDAPRWVACHRAEELG